MFPILLDRHYNIYNAMLVQTMELGTKIYHRLKYLSGDML